MRNLKNILKTALAVMLLSQVVLTAGTLLEDRKYEPAVFTAQEIKGFQNVPVTEIFAFAYNSTSGTWAMIPFQIDEQTLGPNPFSAIGYEKWFYFPEIWADIDSVTTKTHNGIFDDHDELVFMINDMGDKAPDNSWIDNEEAKKNDRLEIVLSDTNDAEKKAYIYLYRTNTFSKQDIPRPYEFAYSIETNSLSTKFYTFDFDSPGLVKGVTIKQPGGSGTNIVDRLKARLYTVINLYGSPLEIALTEEALFSEGLYVTQDPIVRLIRMTDFNLKVGIIYEQDHAFLIDTKFYPFNGNIKGGSDLSPDSLEKHEQQSLEFKIKDLRFSWDFNASASGMKFFNQYNENVPVDGNPDNVTKTIDVPADKKEQIKFWSMLSGNQGTVFSFGKFVNTELSAVELYYYDNQNGGQADQDIFKLDKDTGDNKSYGDNGILFRASPWDTLVFRLDYTLYFIPEKNITKSIAENLVYNLINPVKLETKTNVIVSVNDENTATVVKDFNLAQNYPNPFNNSTQFVFDLPSSDNITLNIYNTNGRLVKTLAFGFYTTGSHKLHWDGTDEQGLEVPSGIYFYQLNAGKQMKHKKLILIR